MDSGHTSEEGALFCVELACELARVPSAVEHASRFLLEQGCTEPEIRDCELALVEGCNNAVQHAPTHARRRSVVIRVRCAPQVIELRVIDHTEGFDWPGEVALPNPETEHGRGLYLIRSVMTETQYLRSPGENTLVLRKLRTVTA